MAVTHAHALQLAGVLKELGVKASGLSSDESQKRLLQYGLNKLVEKKPFSILGLFISQFNNFLVYLLIAAGSFSYFIGEEIDAIVIFIIVIINGILGFFQEYRAEQSIEALKKIETLHARVVRDGTEQTVEAHTLVPGDIILLYEGEKIPADARVMEAYSLEVDESLLTGESLPVAKHDTVVAKHAALGDRFNMVHSGCVITRGRGKAVVVSTGMSTELGKIAQQIHEAPEEQTPLQLALARLGKILGTLCVAIVIPGVLIGFYKDRPFVETIMTAIALAVSAIPEGLPIVVTIALATGIRRMTKVNVLMRRLSSAEGLGGIDVICSDKTGTITLNRMTLSSIFTVAGGFSRLKTNGKEASEGAIVDDQDLDKKFKLSFGKKEKTAGSDNLIELATLCSDATIDFGDPTEKAIIATYRIGPKTEQDVREAFPRIDEIPFQSASKYMAVAVKRNGKTQAIVKGAPEVVLSFTTASPSEKKRIAEITEYLSEQGQRVLAVAEKHVVKGEKLSQVTGYTFVGLVGMTDPPRKEVAEAIQLCRDAGIRTIMITGDHKKTAEAIAKAIGLKTPAVLTGEELDKMDENQFTETVKKVNVFARVSPSHKVGILKALQALGHRVAMTGDGVNDAPAIKRANVGVAVGSGTDLAKGISDMILLDDNFSTIVKGVKEGRRIFANIKKFVLFLMSANFDEIFKISTSLLFGIPLPLVAIQILWLNLATDSLPALALTQDSAEPDIMKQKPYVPQKEILTGVIPMAVIAGIVSYIFGFLLVFVSALYVFDMPYETALTISFSGSVFFEFFLVFAIRSSRHSFLTGLFSNPLIWLSVVLGAGAQLVVMYHPVMQNIFKTTTLTANQFLIMMAAASSGFVCIELFKMWKRATGRA